jgi:hypothetical protein
MSRTGYGFKDAGDKQHGVGTDSEKAAEAARLPGGVCQM